jgi:8-oxo-dGTP pyrophosphatase MutT (NUDIX family)
VLRDSRPLSAKGVYLDDAGRVLLCLNWRDEWELPGGRPAPGENLEACVAHEVREETGLIVVADEMLSRYMFEVEPGHWINIVTGCSLVGGQTVAASDEHQTVAFIDVREPEGRPLPDGATGRRSRPGDHGDPPRYANRSRLPTSRNRVSVRSAFLI